MGNYNKQGGGNRFGGGSGKPSFGGGHSGRPAFAKKSWGGDSRSTDRPVALHRTTCVECSKSCEVPFRPMNGKPVYCKECFDKRGGGAGADRGGDRFSGGDRFPKRDFSSHSPAKPQFESNRGGDDMKKQLEAVNSKLERLIQAVEALASNKSVKVKDEPQETRAIAPKKISKKKAVKK